MEKCHQNGMTGVIGSCLLFGRRGDERLVVATARSFSFQDNSPWSSLINLSAGCSFVFAPR